MKFKDLRGSLLSLVLFVFDIALIIYGCILGSKIKIIYGVLVFPIIVIGYLRQFYIRVYDDFMIIHHFIGILSMPVILQFDDILDIQLSNQYKFVIIAKKRKYAIYCFNAEDKVTFIKGKWDEYNEKN